jgi:hypothetical protein
MGSHVGKRPRRTLTVVQLDAGGLPPPDAPQTFEVLYREGDEYFHDGDAFAAFEEAVERARILARERQEDIFINGYQGVDRDGSLLEAGEDCFDSASVGDWTVRLVATPRLSRRSPLAGP